MRNFEHNRNKASIWESKPVLSVLFVVMLVFAWSVIRFYLKLGSARQNRALVAEKVETLKAQQETLTADIQKLETNRGKEEVFRENYGLAKAGEEVIVIVEDKTPPPEPKKGPLSGLINFFKNIWR